MKKFDSIKAHAAARRKEYFANGGTAKGWSMLAGAGRHGDKETKAAKSKKACRVQIKVATLN